MSFGYLIDYRCPPKDALGGTVAAATQLAEGAHLEPDRAGACGPCAIAASSFAGSIGLCPPSGMKDAPMMTTGASR